MLDLRSLPSVLTRTLIPLPLPVAFFYDCPGSNDSDSSWNFGAKFAVDQTFHVMVRPGDTVNISQITGPHAIRVYLGWGGACPGDNPVPDVGCTGITGGCVNGYSQQDVGSCGDDYGVIWSVDHCIAAAIALDQADTTVEHETMADRPAGCYVTSAGELMFNDGRLSQSQDSRYVTFRANFHHFDRFELDLHGHIHVQGAAFSCLRLKWADMVLI